VRNTFGEMNFTNTLESGAYAKVSTIFSHNFLPSLNLNIDIACIRTYIGRARTNWRMIIFSYISDIEANMEKF